MAIASEVQIQRVYEDESVAKSYVNDRFTSELTRLLHRRQVDTVQRAIDQERPKRILEVAPGPGRITRCLESTSRILCLEFSTAMISEGRVATAARADWVRGNAFRLPFSRQFDLAYSFRFVRHFHQVDRERIYREVRSVLKPGGVFLMDAVNRRVSQPLRDAHPEDYPIYDKLYLKEELCEELSAAGLEPITVMPVQKFYTSQALITNLIGPRANWLNRWLIHGLERLPRRDGLEWIVTCRCE